MVGASASNIFTQVELGGAGYVRAYQDLNQNGVYDEEADVLMVKKLPAQRQASVEFAFGDIDGDGVKDKDEIMQGSDYRDRGSFRVNATLRYTDIDSGRGYTNLAMVASADCQWDPSKVSRAVTNEIFEFYVDSVATNGVVFVLCLHDKDGDREYDQETEELTVTEVKSPGNSKVEIQIGDYDDDGIGDGEEEIAGTDPYDAGNFVLRFRMDVSNSDCHCGVTNYVTISESSATWQPDAVVTSFVGYAAVFVHEQEVTNGVLYVKCMRDFDGDGTYTPGVDMSYGTVLGYASNDGRNPLVVGDCDGDRLVDSCELSEGTNLRNAGSHCFNLSATLTRVVTTSNGCLTAVAVFGDDSSVVYGPSLQSGSTLTVDFGHRVTTSGEKARFRFWEDLNSNGVWEVGERKTEFTCPVTGHDMCITNMMPLGDFDMDGDGMLDDWEMRYGLNPLNADDAKGDVDGDGFVNLHEFWAGTCPTNAVENGEGTALYAACHAVDDRIGAVTCSVSVAKSLFSDYVKSDSTNTNLTRNPLCWMNDVDISCSSIRNDTSYHYGDCATLISPQHIIEATHVSSMWLDHGYYFRSTNGIVTLRKVIGGARIGTSDIYVALLDSPLSDEYRPARLLPRNYESYIGNGAYVASCWQNQNKQMSVQELYAIEDILSEGYIKGNMGSIGIRGDYHQDAVGNDSGNPGFMLFENEIVLLFCTHRRQRGNAGSPDGPNIALFVNEIQAAIDTLSDEAGFRRFTLGYFDFYGFRKLSE